MGEVRLIKKPDGKSKGYAFVEFEDRDSAVAALARDNEQLDGRPMYVSEVGQNKKEGSAFKFKTELEKNKLFVRGIFSKATAASASFSYSTKAMPLLCPF